MYANRGSLNVAVAPAPTDDEREHVRQLVWRLYELSGARSQSEFARRCEVLPSQVSDWLRGQNAPSAYSLVKMMDVAGAFPDGKPGDVALLTRIVDLLEQDPTRASGDLAPYLEELATQLAVLSSRLRQATARSSERWRSG